jgi:hypothetical protein
VAAQTVFLWLDEFFDSCNHREGWGSEIWGSEARGGESKREPEMEERRAWRWEELRGQSMEYQTLRKAPGSPIYFSHPIVESWAPKIFRHRSTSLFAAIDLFTNGTSSQKHSVSGVHRH